MKEHRGMRQKEGHGGNMHYIHLLVMVVLSFISMYIFMYSKVDSFAHVYSNLNQFYMAGVMTAPMVLIELALMRAMYSDKKLNAIILGSCIVVLIGFFTLIRQQTAITDKQFLRSMIPHHAGAILMCEKSPAENPAIRELCKNIISSQKTEIEQMKALLTELEK